MNEIATVNAETLPAHASPAIEASAIFEKVIALASNRDTNPEMFDRLVAWQERERASQSEEEYNAAMNAAQTEIHPVVRTTENTQTRSFYAKLEAVDAAIRPIYLKHGFNVSYNTVPPLVAGNVRVECEVARGRHSKKYYREAPADTLGPKGTSVKTALHGGGSTETFLKRYAVCGAFNVVFANQDDDGNFGGTKFIDAAQCREIEGLLIETKTDRGRFLQHFAIADVPNISDGEQYVQVRNTLQTKLSRMKAAESDFPGDRP